MKIYRKPYRIKKKRLIFKSFYFWFSILIFVFLIFGIYFLFFSDFFLIKKIEISREKRIKKDEIENFLKNILEKKFLIFKRRNIFLANLNQIKKEILTNFPVILDLKFERKFPNSINLKILERKEVAFLCQEDNCFLIDENGILFWKERPEGLLKIEILNLNEELNLGKKIVEKELLSKILEVEKKLKELNLNCEKVSIISEDNLHFKTGENWEIFLDPQKDIDWQITKLSVSLKEAIPKEKRKNLEYIDLRFGNFAYPKYKD